MSRKEVFATTGTRLLVRIFGGFDFAAKDARTRPISPSIGYEQGVPMGGDLQGAPHGKAPSFLIRALRDADGATSIASRSSRAGSIAPARHRRRSTTSPGASRQRKPGADGKLPASATPSTWRTPPTPTRSALPSSIRLERPGVRPHAARVLLRARAGDSDAALDRPTTPSSSSAHAAHVPPHSGARLHLADLVHAVSAC